jgi:hypothetical protein
MSSTVVQQKQRKFVKCGEKTGTGCGQPITFDTAYRGKNGGWVPLEEYLDAGQKLLRPHNCPVKKQQHQPVTRLGPKTQYQYQCN